MVDITHWRRSEDFAIHPVGSKPKRMVFAPTDAEEPFLLPSHAYLFKTALGFRAPQIWSEVIAYRVAAVIGLPVPPCFIAHDRQTGETGALVEFFFGYPGELSPARLVHAVDALMSLGANGDPGPHTVLGNARATRIFLGSTFGMSWWASVYAFDALIANTDRHTENWGFLVRRDIDGNTSYSIAPIFDNGTSLGYQFGSERLGEMRNRAALSRFNTNGVHECGWDAQNPKSLGHFELCERFLATYPDTKRAMLPVSKLDSPAVAAILNGCMMCDVPVAFDAQRAAFVEELLLSRRDHLVSILSRA